MQTSRSALRPVARSILKSPPPLYPIASRVAIRTLATVVPENESPAIAASPSSRNGALRPHLNIPVDPNHGLYAFFRKTEKDGVVSYESLDAKDPLKDNTGSFRHPTFFPLFGTRRGVLTIFVASCQVAHGPPQSCGGRASRTCIHYGMFC